MSRNRTWIAMATDIMTHDVVGPNVKTPSAADPQRPVWNPFTAWMWMLTETEHRDRTRVVLGCPVHLRRGQIALAERHLAKNANWSRSAARAFLGRLELAGMIRRSTPDEADARRQGQLALDFDAPKTSPPLAIVTICNYEKFQRPIGRQSPGGVRVESKTPQGHRQENSDSSSRSLQNTITQEDARDEKPSGTDGAPGDRLPFTEAALAACEAMGFTRKTLVDRYYQRTKRRAQPIRDPSAYLIEMAIDMAAKARGVPKEALRASLSRNASDRAAAYAEATAAPPTPSEMMRKAVTRRCERAGFQVSDMLAAWHASIGSVRILHADQHLDFFCSRWLSGKAGRVA